MSPEILIEHYGYLGILVGTFLEGETVLVLGAVAAHLGFLDFTWVVAFAFTGTLVGDQLYFFLGRRHGQAAVEKRPHWAARADKVTGILQRHGAWAILGYRFLYGMRTVAAFAIGTSRVSTVKFVTFGIVGALIWAVTIGIAGYLFGYAFQHAIGRIKHYELAVMGAVTLLGATLWLIHLYRARRVRSG